jgi:hypothetical protein
MKQPFESNGNGHQGIGVSNPVSPATEEDFSDLKYIDVEAAGEQGEAKEGRTRRKRRKVMGGLLFLGVLALVIGLFFWMTTGGKKKIDLAVRDRNAQSGGVDPQKTDDVTSQAIAEVRGTTPSPSPATSPAPAAGAAPGVSSAPVTIPLGGTVTTVEGAPGTNTAGASSADAKAAVAERNPERSIRCAPVPKLVATSNQTNAGVETVQAARRIPAALPRETETGVVLPPFGALLPVRTLGAIYTLRPGLARFELTRDVRGRGWLLKRGTVLIGGQQGSEYDRAYITLMGFIDPDSGRLVKLAGDAIGADGGPGVQGKRRQISSRWGRVLNRVANNAVTLGQAALSRGSGVSVYLPNPGSEIGLSPSALSRREFVEIPAGTSAYILITDLPKEARGVDPQPLIQVGARGNGGEENSAALTDTELAELLSAGTPEQIRAALPRMRPELRQIAEMVLKESGK